LNNKSEQWEAVIEIGRDIERAARHMKVEWPGLVEQWEDLAADISIKLVTDNYATTVRGMDPKPRRMVLVKIASRVVSELRDEFDFFQGNFFYSTKEVRGFLERGALEGFSEVAVDQNGNESDETTPLMSLESPDRSVLGKRQDVESFDIRVGFGQLEAHHQEMLVRRFVKGERMDQAVDRVKVQRAVDQLTSVLNRSYRKDTGGHQGPGSRTAMSNNQAVGRTRGEY
jgi:hypothetical protein